MVVKAICSGPKCSKTIRAEAPSVPKGMGIFAKDGWVYRNGQIGKSVVTMVCPDCRPEPLVLEADFDPRDV